MSRSIAALGVIIILSLFAGLARDVQAFGLGRQGAGFGRLGSLGAAGVVTPVVCIPGAPTGQMDFSVCSNIAITAAAMP